MPSFRAIALNSRYGEVDMNAQMLKPFAPMSNTERQRRFRARNPGYYGRLHRKRNAGAKAMLKRLHAEAQAKAQAEIQARIQVEAEIKHAIVNLLPPISRQLPAGGAAPLDPLAMEIAALAEKRRAHATIHVRQV